MALTDILKKNLNIKNLAASVALASMIACSTPATLTTPSAPNPAQLQKVHTTAQGAQTQQSQRIQESKKQDSLSGALKSPASYTVQKGDTLWGIAHHKLNLPNTEVQSWIEKIQNDPVNQGTPVYKDQIPTSDLKYVTKDKKGDCWLVRGQVDNLIDKLEIGDQFYIGDYSLEQHPVQCTKIKIKQYEGQKHEVQKHEVQKPAGQKHEVQKPAGQKREVQKHEKQREQIPPPTTRVVPIPEATQPSIYEGKTPQPNVDSDVPFSLQFSPSIPEPPVQPVVETVLEPTLEPVIDEARKPEEPKRKGRTFWGFGLGKGTFSNMYTDASGKESDVDFDTSHFVLEGGYESRGTKLNLQFAKTTGNDHQDTWLDNTYSGGYGGYGWFGFGDGTSNTLDATTFRADLDQKVLPSWKLSPYFGVGAQYTDVKLGDCCGTYDDRGNTILEGSAGIVVGDFDENFLKAGVGVSGQSITTNHVNQGDNMRDDVSQDYEWYPRLELEWRKYLGEGTDKKWVLFGDAAYMETKPLWSNATEILKEGNAGHLSLGLGKVYKRSSGKETWLYVKGKVGFDNSEYTLEEGIKRDLRESHTPYGSLTIGIRF